MEVVWKVNGDSTVQSVSVASSLRVVSASCIDSEAE